jgi:hypothetical protein
MTQIQGRKIKTRISPDILDTIGKSFKFKHGKGVAEWLKNSLDQYLRSLEKGEETLSGNWPVFINLIDAPTQSKGPNLAVIDFGGTTYQKIEDFFLYWGDKSAASHGGTISTKSLTGGHGNGGKFYMREMWRDGARFLTWKNGKATSILVMKTEDNSTGFFEIENQEMKWRDAFEFALSSKESLGGGKVLIEHLESALPDMARGLDSGTRGFSAIVGRRAVQTLSAHDIVNGGKWKYQKLIDDIKDAQQARRPIRELSISVFINSVLQIPRILPPAIESDPDWADESHTILADNLKGLKKPQKNECGELKIQKSTNQLIGGLKDLNSLYVLDDKGNPVGTYGIYELPFPGHSPLLSFIHAEIQLEFKELNDLITNDREKLVDSEITKDILEWCAQKIWSKIEEIEKTLRKQKQKSDLEIADKLNQSLNKHAQKFLQQIQAEILVNYVLDPTGGGLGGDGEGAGGTKQGSGEKGKREHGKGGGEGSGGDKEIEGKEKKINRSRYPRILLSGYDSDPAKENFETKELTDRHPPLHQDDIDRLYNVWWLNTSHPFADKAIKRGGPEGHAFKNHHLSMFRDMVQRESLRILQRREVELPLDRIENELDEISNKFLAELPWELVETLLQ